MRYEFTKAEMERMIAPEEVKGKVLSFQQLARLVCSKIGLDPDKCSGASYHVSGTEQPAFGFEHPDAAAPLN